MEAAASENNAARPGKGRAECSRRDGRSRREWSNGTRLNTRAESLGGWTKLSGTLDLAGAKGLVLAFSGALGRQGEKASHLGGQWSGLEPSTGPSGTMALDS